GDPGESRFYLSLEDELMRLFKADWVDRILQVLKIPDDVPIENKRVTGAIANAQGQIEAQNFDSRKNVLKYDDVMDRQRHVIYAERRKVLEGADLEEQISTFIDDVVEGFVTGATEGFAEEWDLDALQTQLAQLWPVSVDLNQMAEEVGGVDGLERDDVIAALQEDAHAAYARREEEVGAEVMRELERRVVLSVLDRKWREHLYEMDYLREGIGLRGYAQRDPLVEYQREGFDMFMAIMDGIKEESVGFLFNLDVQLVDDDEDELEADADVAEPLQRELRSMEQPGLENGNGVHDHRPHITAKGLEQSRTPQHLSYSAPSEEDTALAVPAAFGGDAETPGRPPAHPGTTVTNTDDEFADVGRNALCPCGSGKKYKRCHGAPGGPTGLTARING
ncbi:MAG TPA: SEC-C metal-binding domain-containing protein, partial [Nocardioides sp.]|nr:SEC-C metal-binding domain-containing protein [Nocardioides sp.]